MTNSIKEEGVCAQTKERHCYAHSEILRYEDARGSAHFYGLSNILGYEDDERQGGMYVGKEV